jgi:hypothetical protein
MMAKLSANLEKNVWPFPDDRLLGKVLSWNNVTSFSAHPDERPALMLRGYFRAGHVLVEKCSKNLNEAHALIYPILFCYRHALEMAMQGIVSAYGHRYGVSLPTKKDHNLDPLWKCCKAIFTHPDNKSAAVGASRVEKVIKQFHSLDIRNEAFRYSEKKDGTFIPLPNDAIDLINLREIMKRLESFFTGAEGHLDLVQSANDEMERS